MQECSSLRIYGWLGKINETSIPEKENFCCSNLNIEDCSDEDYWWLLKQIMGRQKEFVNLLK